MKESQMRTVGSFEGKNKLNYLLGLAEQGEEILITRHGREVARLLPARTAFAREAVKKAAGDIREMSAGVSLGNLGIEDLIDEGRKWLS
jgi:prevent-host-death family protein